MNGGFVSKGIKDKIIGVSPVTASKRPLVRCEFHRRFSLQSAMSGDQQPMQVNFRFEPESGHSHRLNIRITQ